MGFDESRMIKQRFVMRGEVLDRKSDLVAVWLTSLPRYVPCVLCGENLLACVLHILKPDEC